MLIRDACAVALYCQRCGSIHIHDVPLFSSNRTAAVICESCGHEKARLIRLPHGRVAIDVSCVVCGTENRFVYELRRLPHIGLEKIYCAADRFELGYLGRPKRIEELFFDFLRLVPIHFAEHHDVGFYASQLCITPRYLSQIVRDVSGRTVVDYINEMLLMEASYLLQQTSLPIVDIADRLHFSETASFTRFFTRMKGMNPREFRKGK